MAEKLMKEPSGDSSFLTNSNAAFLADLYAKYLKDPDSIDSSWSNIFANLDADAADLLKELHGASWQQEQFTIPQEEFNVYPAEAIMKPINEPKITAADLAELSGDPQQILDSIHALMLIRSYRVLGHLESNLDPLGIEKRKPNIELDPAFHGFTKNDWDREIYVASFLGGTVATLREIKAQLSKIYSGTIGVEYMHIQNSEQKSWIQDRLENYEERYNLTREQKMGILDALVRAEHFEKFLHVKYPGAKRFGLDGGESTIPCLMSILNRALDNNVDEIIFGMAHRGRLNVLNNVIGKSAKAIFSEFQGTPAHPDDVQGSGDVKYHLGCSTTRTFGDKQIHLSLTANPSHLEAVDPVVLGKVRAKQAQQNDDTRSKIFGLLMHGDAAFAGQGLVSETLSLSELPGYRVGGTMHLVINNQIGFTTSPKHSRSSPYSSDVAKMIQAPIFHVNGDDVEAVSFISKMAMDFRHQFKKDVVIDLFCYRKHGHNEIDEPAFTQPLMYQAIAKQKSTLEKYADKLISENVITADEYKQILKVYDDELQADFKAAETFKPKKADWLDGVWAGFNIANDDNRHSITGIPEKLLKTIGAALTKHPDGFTVHPRLERILKEKAAKIESEKDIDWATAEALAFGSLLCEGKQVRLSGQDSGRGTFSQRHAVFRDQQTEAAFIPLNHIQPVQCEIEVLDSPLSEMSVLGFEYGMSLADPHKLVMWEAQFGDFANGAQVMFDQFISSGEAKWLRMSGLVVLLPHGYEGQGPEHSSARLERFLQCSAEGNWQVANCTTPANYFHILRRQIHRNIRKPLIIMTPKSLLRNKMAVSSFRDMIDNTSFLPVIGETDPKANSKDRVILCSGKVYYDLLERRMGEPSCKVPIIRVEQLYPFPAKEIAEQLKSHQHAQVIWCQEEPENMGSWAFIDRRLEKVLVDLKFKNSRPIYAGRAESASTATGYNQKHIEQQNALVNEALGLKSS